MVYLIYGLMGSCETTSLFFFILPEIYLSHVMEPPPFFVFSLWLINQLINYLGVQGIVPPFLVVFSSKRKMFKLLANAFYKLVQLPCMLDKDIFIY